MRFPQWRLHDGDGAASDNSANGSVETEELPSPTQNELDNVVDELVGQPAAAAGERGAASGLRLDLRLLDGNANVELNTAGDVVGVPTLTPADEQMRPSLPCSPEGGVGDWLNAYSNTTGTELGTSSTQSGQAAGDSVLSPLLTPSGSKLSAALVDAF